MSNQPKWLAFDGQKIKDPFFPVELCDAAYERTVIDQDGVPVQEIKVSPRHRAVVDVETDYVFSMVTDSYELITNRDAIELGKECFKTVFTKVDHQDMELFNSIMPATRSFCHMDLVHKDAEYNYFGESPWTPYIRITNSYNRTKLLQFDIGFCRGACRNGLIFRPESIVFKKSHRKSATEELQEQFTLQRGTFEEMEEAFTASLRTLGSERIPKKFMWPLFCKVFSVSKPDDSTSQSQALRFTNLKTYVSDLVDKYCTELGENGFAAMNVLTDYASRPKYEVGGESGRAHSMQVASGIWIEDFSNEVKKPNFHIGNYLGPHMLLAT